MATVNAQEIFNIASVDYASGSPGAIPKPGIHRCSLRLPGSEPGEEAIIVGRTHGTATDEKNDITIRLTTQDNPTLISWIEIRFFVTWVDDAGKLTKDTACSLRFTRLNLDLNHEKLKPIEYYNSASYEGEARTKVKEFFNITNSDDDDEKTSQLFDAGEFTVVALTLKKDGDQWPINLYNDHTYGSQTATIRRVETFFKNARRAWFLIRIINASVEFDTLNENFAAEKKADPLRAWVALGKANDDTDLPVIKDSTALFVQRGYIREPLKRPISIFPSLLTFQSFDLYQLVGGMFSITEYEYQQESMKPIQNVPATLFTINGFGDRAYLMICRFDKKKHRVSRGTSCGVAFNGQDYPELRFPSKALDYTHYQSLSDTAFLVYRPLVKDSKEVPKPYLRLDPDVMANGTIKDLNSPLEALHAFQVAKSITVIITLHASDSAHKRQINSLRQIQVNMKDKTRGIRKHDRTRDCLTLHDIQGLGFVDAFADCVPVVGTIEEAMESTIARFTLDEDQQAALMAMRYATGGHINWDGPAGTGKTRLIQAVIYICLVSRRSDGSACQSIGCAPINAAATRIVTFCQENFGDLTEYKGKKLSPFVFTRMHNPATEKKILLKQSKRQENVVSRWKEEDSFDLRAMHAATSIMATIGRSLTSKLGLNDQRVTDIKTSLGYQMARIAGIVEPGGPLDMRKQLSADENTKGFFTRFVNMYARYDRNDVFSPDEKSAFSDSINKFRTLVLNMSSVIATSTNMTGDAKLTLAKLNPVFVYDDESPKGSEADAWCYLANFPYAFYVHAGDHRQNRPTQLSDTNPFRSQGRLPYSTRARIAGITTIELRFVKRYSLEVGTVIAFFYDEGFRLAPAMPGQGDNHVSRAKIRSFIMATFSISKQAMAISISESLVQLAPDNPSKFNEVSLATVGWVLEKLVLFEFPLHWVGIITPYASQQALLSRIIDHLTLKYPKAGLEHVWWGTYDSLQGGQVPLLLAETVVNQELGFMVDDNRPTAGLSRAQVGLIIIINAAMTYAAQWQKLRLSKIWTYLGRNGATYQLLPETDNLDDIAELLPSALNDIVDPNKEAVEGNAPDGPAQAWGSEDADPTAASNVGAESGGWGATGENEFADGSGFADVTTSNTDADAVEATLPNDDEDLPTSSAPDQAGKDQDDRSRRSSQSSKRDAYSDDHESVAADDGDEPVAASHTSSAHGDGAAEDAAPNHDD